MTASVSPIGDVGRLATAPNGTATTDLLRAHTAYLRMAGYRPKSIRARCFTVEAFGRHIAPRTLADATKLDVEEYLTRPLKPESRRSYRSHLKAFYAWALEDGLVADDPTRRIPAIRVPRGVPRPISTAELSAALSVADPRMRSWLLLMALGGLRCLEVAGLRPEDVVSTDSGPVLHLRETKGGGTATVPAHPRIVEALAMVPMRDGIWWDCGAPYVSKQVGEHLRAAGVNATAHKLRHYAGTAWFKASGNDIITTARLLRHASIQTTQIYAAVDPARPTEVVNLVPMAMPDDGVDRLSGGSS